MKSKKLIVPLDGSNLAEKILPWAKQWADAWDYQLVLLRCIRPLASVYAFPDFASPEPLPFDLDGFQRLAKTYLENAAKRAGLTEVECCVVESEPADFILKRSEEEDVAGVFLSSHGVGGLGRWLLGSVTTQVVRGSRKPVFVLKHSDNMPECKKPANIMVALDGSDTSATSMSYAVDMAEKFDSKLHLYKAVQFTAYPYTGIDDSLKNEPKTSEAKLQELASEYPDRDISVRADISSPSTGILKASEQADLLVIASHGHGGIERWLLGSVTEKVLNQTNLPVFIVCSQ